jgi:hypothetical protein
MRDDGGASDDGASDAESSHASRSASRSRMKRGSTFVRGGNPNMPYRGKLAHWTLAPCAPLRFLHSLYLHGNQLRDYREVLTLAYMSRDTLLNLTWHGNPGVDAHMAQATAAARALLPRLKNLNFTRLTPPPKHMTEQRSLAKRD